MLNKIKDFGYLELQAKVTLLSNYTELYNNKTKGKEISRK